MTTRVATTDSEPDTTAVRAATVVYALLAATPLVWFASFVAIIVAYVAKETVGETWVASHLRWQRRTFWFALLWVFIGSLIVYLLIGFVVWGATLVWFVYRVARGWLHLSQGLPMYA